ncbi:MAG: hypothetical protein PHX18_02095 [Candidatus Gastranaerophilales bacterium]|nr:hypothetical protein [Candidatus Gastranaerophilales bacterium]
MKLANKFASDLTDKDKNKARQAAKYIIDNKDMEAWRCFVENSDNIFPFIKQNIASYFSDVIDENNYQNLFELFKIHSLDWDECFVQILLRFSYSNKELNDKMFELLKIGSEDEKAYAAKFFSFITNNATAYYLFDAYSGNYEPLKYNCAKALGDMGDNYSYEYYMNKLEAEDDWEKTDAAQFLQWYGNKKAFIPILKAMSKSSMPEHIAGAAAMLEAPNKYYADDDKCVREFALDCYQHLITSLAEIWPLSTIIDFKIYESIGALIDIINAHPEKDLISRYAVLLLKTKYLFQMFYENDIYKFNETQETLKELEEIFGYLSSLDNAFWQICEDAIAVELIQEENSRVCFALELISDLNLENYIDTIKNILKGQNSEKVIYQAVMTLASVGEFYGVDKEFVLSQIKDENLKPLIDSTIPEL